MLSPMHARTTAIETSNRRSIDLGSLSLRNCRLMILGGALSILGLATGSYRWWKRRVAFRSLQRSIQLRTQGNALYKTGRRDEALTKYLLAQDCLAPSGSGWCAWASANDPQVVDARTKAQLNCVMVYLDQGRHRDAIRSCNAILQQSALSRGEATTLQDTQRAKVLFRRGKAYEEIGERNQSLSDYQSAEVLCPHDMDIRRAVSRLQEISTTQ